ncbi:MAG: SH3 domain-containing protein [Chloroflexota bacterium]
MKRWLFLLLFVNLLGFSPALMQDNPPTSLTVTTPLLNVRSGPGTNNTIITHVQQGETYPILGHNDAETWWQISVDDQTGWVSGAYVDLDNAQPEATTAPCPYGTYMIYQCPDSQVSVSVTVQLFQGGMMIWRSDTHEIYILFKSGEFQNQPDTWTGETLPQETPPPGLLQPQMGFGVIWLDTTYATIRQGLGWATAGESSYSALIEATNGTSPAPSDNEVFVRLADGKVVRLYFYIDKWSYYP